MCIAYLYLRVYLLFDRRTYTTSFSTLAGDVIPRSFNLWEQISFRWNSSCLPYSAKRTGSRFTPGSTLSYMFRGIAVVTDQDVVSNASFALD